MDSFEWNKVIASVLIGGLLFMGVTFLSDAFFPEHKGEGVGLDGATAVSNETPVETAEPSILEALLSADPVAGERSFRKCQACHTSNEGGNNGVGPNLYNVVGSPKGAHPGYTYSSAISEAGGNWTYENLNEFLASPQTAMPGTKMSFAGIRTIEERANIIAYLRSQSANPIPLPEAPAGEEAAAEDVAVQEAAEEASETEAENDGTQ